MHTKSNQQLTQEFAERSKALRDDIRMLGNILGETIKRFEGEEIFQHVETLRALFKRIHRQGDDSVRGEIDRIVESLDLNASTKVIKAFLTYFDIINIAEQNHRLRRRALRESDNGKAPADTLHAVLSQNNPLTRKTLLDLIHNLDIEVVFTAHPTEITRRTVLFKQLELAKLLYKRDHPPLTHSDRQSIESGLRNVVESLWLTDHVIYFKPAVVDEVRYGGFTSTMWLSMRSLMCTKLWSKRLLN